MNGRPNDVRGLIHRRIFGGIKGAIGGLLTGGPLGALGGALGGIFPGGPRVARALPTIAQSAGCPPGFQLTTQGCMPIRAPVQQFAPIVPTTVTPVMPPTIAAVGLQEFGDAVVGRFGAAIEPAVRPQETRVCPRGTVLGQDGLCYNRRDIRNDERFWPRGRRPLLTGGEMRCISIAASAARKLQRKQKQLESLGMLKKPTRRAAPKQLTAGHHAHISHD